jgi:hypothetical protein
MADDTIKEETVDAGQDDNFSFVTEQMPQESDDTFYDYEENQIKPQTEESVEESKEETPKETQEAETQEVSEITEVPNKENPSRFEFWQSKFTQEQNARKELEDKLHSFEQKMESFANPPKVEEELAPPVKPNSDEPLDKLSYLEQQNEYLAKVISKMDGNLKQREEAEKQAKETAHFKSVMIGAYQDNGADQNLSAETFDFYNSQQSLDPKVQLAMYQAYKNSLSSQSDKKATDIKAKTEKYGTPLPPGVVSGEQPKQKEPSFGEDMVDYYKSTRII